MKLPYSLSIIARFLIALSAWTGTSLGQSQAPKDKEPNEPTPLRQPPQRPLVPSASGALGGGALNQQQSGRQSALSPARGGPKNQRAEFLALLKDATPPDATPPTPERDLTPGAPIYGDVTYLMPLRDAISKAGLTGKLQSGGRTAAVGLPEGYEFVEISADAERRYASRMLTDKQGRMAAVEFVANDPRMLPPLPGQMPQREMIGATFDFVPQGITAIGARYRQYAWHMNGSVVIATRNGPKSANLYIPKPMVAFIIHWLESAQ
jgi:hypothetical protein